MEDTEYCMVRGGMVTMEVTLVYRVGLIWPLDQLLWVTLIIVVELYVVWVARFAHCMVLGMSISDIWA